jgi:hypothetical protein
MAVAAGAGSVVVGLVQAQVGETNAVTRIPSIIFPTVITLWLVWMGVLLLRKAPVLERTRPRQIAVGLAAPTAPAAERHPSADRQVAPGPAGPGAPNDPLST